MSDSSRCNAQDSMAAIQALVADDRLARYFHLELPERKGVLLSDAAGVLGLDRVIALAPRVDAAPAITPVPPGWVALIVDGVDCTPNQIAFRFRLPAEGVSGSGVINRSAAGHWSATRIDLVER